MGQFLLYLISGMCMLVYVPAALLAVQEIFTRKATFSLSALRLHFTGTGAVLFGLGQLFSAFISISGILLAIQNSNIFYIVGGVLLGAIAALIGLWMARKTQAGELEIVTPPGLNMNIHVDGQSGFVFHEDTKKEDYNQDDILIIEEDDNERPNRTPPSIPTDDDIIEAEYTEVDTDNDIDDD